MATLCVLEALRVLSLYLLNQFTRFAYRVNSYIQMNSQSQWLILLRWLSQ
jgi:hypothetical protein